MRGTFQPNPSQPGGRHIPRRWRQPPVTPATSNSRVAVRALSVLLIALTPCFADETLSPDNEKQLLSNTRQIVFEGIRSGEGYFSADGKRMVYQSEREPGNPFYQIYVSDLETGDNFRVSPGIGKTTCGWIHPDGNQVLFASTHENPDAKQQQIAELEKRKSGKQSRYSWDYDPTYELYVTKLSDIRRGGDVTYQRITNAQGYDAEGSFSPDGKQIAFASNRIAYTRELSSREREFFETDPAYLMEIYIMNADGSDVRQLTSEPGYDGGPFFSPDGRRICWRRFSPDGATAEIFSMKTDGSDVRRLTSINAMSWAPYFHPSGDYLIFTTNKHGFANFELYLVRADGRGEPVRVTTTDGFDGLPVFLPDGNQLSWSTTRGGASQIYLADFDDAFARKLLDLDGQSASADADLAAENLQASAPEFRGSDVMRHVDYLTRPELGGRMTGSEGERRATGYVAAYLDNLGFEPAGENGTYFQNFEFPAGSQRGENNRFRVGPDDAVLDRQWTPLSFSRTGNVDASEVVFAGYGLQIPGDDSNAEYDSYVHLDVTDKWVMVLRDVPQNITSEMRQRMARYGDPRRKATVARDLGAKGILFVAGPTSKVSSRLIRFGSDASAEVSIAAVSIDDQLATQILARANEKLDEWQRQLDDGSMAMGIAIPDLKISAGIEITRQTGQGRNVIGRLRAGDATAYPCVMIGAHIDHLGRGGGSNSLARDDERERIHVGADDNASGVAGMLEMAQYLASEKAAGRLPMKHDVIVAAWSGEELGLFGSQAFVEHFSELFPDAPVNQPNPDDVAVAVAHGMTPQAASLHDAIAAYLNLDMVGRLREKLIVQGLGSSPGFTAEVQRRNVPVGLTLQLDRTSTRLPTDAAAFVARGVPILSAFTGAHEDYHTPRDTPEKLNYEGAAKIAKLFGLIARGLVLSETSPEFQLDEGEVTQEAPRANLTAYLGTIPDYAAGEVKGLKLSGVSAGAPADQAGLRGGDVIVNLGGRTIEDIYDYTYAIEALKIGDPVPIVVTRDGKELSLTITPASRN